MTPDLVTLRRQVAEREWYHTIDLGHGVVTPGWFDTRAVAGKLPFPSDLTGMRCLDIGTFDGFWAFEMERRGADVLAIDILAVEDWDWPAISNQADIDAIARRKGRGDGFDITKRALGARAERAEASIYDLDPSEHGLFDLVYLGSLLLHLRDPVLALERVRAVCRGQLLSVDAFDVGLTAIHPRKPVAYLDGQGRPYWWKCNLSGLRRMLTVAGFGVSEGPTPFFMPPGPGHPRPSFRAGMRSREGRITLLGSRKGDPHAWTLATPVPGHRPSRGAG